MNSHNDTEIGLIHSLEPYFHKSNMEHSGQFEYRLVFVTNQKAKDELNIVSTSAAKFCMRVQPK